MKQQFDKFDEVFRDKLGSYEQSPPDDVLNRIRETRRNSSPPAEGSRIVKKILLFVVAGAIISGSAGIISNYLKENDQDSYGSLTSVDQAVVKNLIKDMTPEEFFSNEFAETVSNSESKENEIKISGNSKLEPIHKTDHGISKNSVVTKEAISGTGTGTTDAKSLQSNKSPVENTRTDKTENKALKDRSFVVNSTISPASCHNANGRISLAVSGGTGKINFEWLNSITTSGTNIATDLFPGVYTVWISDETGLAETHTFTVPDTGNPIANFYWDDTSMEPGKPLRFINISSVDDALALNKEGVIYEWTFGDGYTSSEKEPSHTYMEGGSYRVKLTVTTSEGCSDAVENSLAFSKVIFVVPNTFTPNDDGENDYLRFKVLNAQEYSGLIFTSSGKLVFTIKNGCTQWDGKIGGKKFAAEGVYFIYIEATGTDGKVEKYQGSFHIFR